jgi:hypothetical protein
VGRGLTFGGDVFYPTVCQLRKSSWYYSKPEAQFVMFAVIRFLKYRQPDFRICDDVKNGKYSLQARKGQL